MDVFIGTISGMGFNFAPYGWMMCQGQILPIQAYAAMFSLLGTAYGGNGTSNFGLPNLAGRVANGQGSNGQSTYQMGEEGGSSNVNILISNLPPHTHPLQVTLNANSRSQSDSTPVNNFPAPSVTPSNNYSSQTNAVMKPPTITLGNTGGSTPISIQDPILAINYCIAYQGIFPTRN